MTGSRGWTGILFLALALSGGALPPTVAAQDLPYTFFVTTHLPMSADAHS